jgi:hypothetical protein
MKYTYKSKDYYIVEEAEMKNPQTREWEECIIYISLESGRRYVRNKVEFYKLFKNLIK